MWRRTALGLLGIITLTQSALARDHWICIRSDNFELYTEADEGTGRAALVFFEEVRRAFTESLGLKLPLDKPVSIIAFRDEAAYAPYRPGANVAAYTMTLPHRDIIVMQDLVPTHYSVALHEFTHVMIEQAGMKLPVWLNEGFAEVYATMTPVGGKIRVGRILPLRLRTAQTALLDLHEVLNADRRSALYHDPGFSDVFYSESWALVHMLKFSDDYSPHFDRVLEAIGRGVPSEKALQTVYVKSTQQIQTDLQTYVHGDRFREGVIHAKLEKSIPKPVLAAMDSVDIEVMLGQLEARGPHRLDGLKALEDLARENPGKPGPLEAIVSIQLGSPDPQAAIAPFRQAMEAGTRDAPLCYLFAVKMRTRIPDADFVAALRRATEVDPGFAAAQQELAAHAFDSHDYAEAVTRLHLVKKLERANAFVYYHILSVSAFETGNVVEAKSAATKAQQFAVTPEEKKLADAVFQYVNSGKPPASGGSPARQ